MLRRQNLLLKIISLTASILLYYYVQNERNPQATRNLFATVTRESKPNDVEVDTDRTQIEVSVSGPRRVMDMLRDGDIKAVADLSHVPSNDQNAVLAPVTFHTPTLPPELRQELTFDPPATHLRFTVYRQVVQQMAVSVHFPPEAPAGYRYGTPKATPTQVKIVGRAETVKRVERLIVSAAPNAFGSKIEGDFPVIAHDADRNVVESIVLTPASVHVAIPLIEEPLVKIVTVSPLIALGELPELPYRLLGLTTVPQRVQVVGQPKLLDQITTIATEEIWATNFTADQEIEVGLKIPADVIVRDVTTGKPIHRVRAKIRIGMVGVSGARGSSPPPAPPPDSSSTPPKETRP